MVIAKPYKNIAFGQMEDAEKFNVLQKNSFLLVINFKHKRKVVATSDVDPHWLYADPDPQNLLMRIRIQVNKITKLISTHL